MNKCKKCQVEIEDNTMVCPLCKHVLELDKEIEPKTRMYPEVVQQPKVLKMIERIYIFAAILCESILVAVNYFTYRGVRWSLVCGGAFLYLLITLRYSIDNPNAGIRIKILVQSVSFALLVLLCDYSIGYRGWSVDYAIPCLIIVMNIAIEILMLVNVDYWQSFIMLQLFMVFSSGVLILFVLTEVVKHPILSIVAAGISCFLLGLSFVLGERKVINELKRKFHV